MKRVVRSFVFLSFLTSVMLANSLLAAESPPEVPEPEPVIGGMYPPPEISEPETIIGGKYPPPEVSVPEPIESQYQPDARYDRLVKLNLRLKLPAGAAALDNAEAVVRVWLFNPGQADVAAKEVASTRLLGINHDASKATILKTRMLYNHSFEMAGSQRLYAYYLTVHVNSGSKQLYSLHEFTRLEPENVDQPVIKLIKSLTPDT